MENITRTVTLEECINIVCAYCVKNCCEDECPLNDMTAHYEGTETYTKPLDPERF